MTKHLWTFTTTLLCASLALLSFSKWKMTLLKPRLALFWMKYSTVGRILLSSTLLQWEYDKPQDMNFVPLIWIYCLITTKVCQATLSLTICRRNVKDLKEMLLSTCLAWNLILCLVFVLTWHVSLYSSLFKQIEVLV